MRPYRAWINQPSIQQVYHPYHGKRGIVVQESDKSLCIYFSEGDIISIKVCKSHIARSNK